jgi:hypothetical protein
MRLLPLAVILVAASASLDALAEPAPRRVIVTNFPDPQNVTGAVEVTNLPAVQDVNVVSGPPADASPRFQLVGFTSALLSGEQGVLGFTSACQQEFANSRMCTSVEVLETTTVPAGLVGEAWVRPTIVAAPANVVVDASGATDLPDGLSCAGWRTSALDASGLVMDSVGRFRSARHAPTADRGCGVARAVACCGPVP